MLSASYWPLSVILAYRKGSDMVDKVSAEWDALLYGPIHPLEV